MNRPEPTEVASRLVSARFPAAQAAFLAGSVLTPMRTATSDLDIVVVLPGPPAPFRETIREDGWVVELFVQTPTSLRYYWNSESATCKPPPIRMCAEGQVLVSEQDAAFDIQKEAKKRLVRGPLITAEKLMYRRYALTDLLDDFIGAADSTELAYISAALLNSASELALLSQSQWLGSAKWLARHLSELDAGLIDRLTDGQRSVLIRNDKEPLKRAVTEVLDRAGGPITEGYRSDGEDPDRNSATDARVGDR